ncbi:MAG: AbrB/MazE/SpoVT family DNA-binding domain-containing protein [Candidatus Bathyarchaeia archaeon]
MKESVFQVKVQKLRRIAIPRPICDALGIKEGDRVEVIIRKVESDGSRRS